MSTAPQHSDLLFDFGPRGQGGEGAPVDWVPKEPTLLDGTLDPTVESKIATFTFSSLDPLPAPVPPEPPPAQPIASMQGFWLNGDVLMCACPDCRAPMSVRQWLMLADCWNCGTIIELSEEQIREVERVLETAPSASVPTPPLPPPPPPVSAPAKIRSPRPPKIEAPATVAKPAAPKKVAPPNSPASPKPPVSPLPASAVVASATIAPPSRPPAPPPPPTARPPEKTAATAQRQPARRPRREEPEEDSLDIFRALFNDMPAWLLSFILHIALLMLLALMQNEEKDRGPWVMLSATVSPVVAEGGDTFLMPQTKDAKFDLPLPKPEELNDPKKREALLAANQEARQLRLDPNAVDAQLPNLNTVKQRMASASGIKNGITARDPRLRVEMVKAEGGTTLTEAAVARSLRWFQHHQNEEGSWSLNDFQRVENCNCSHRAGLDDNTAGTALALLPYLGAGQSHLVGVYKEEVAKGLRWLLKQQKENGDLRANQGNSGMYAHGQAAIVLCEAFAMTGDEELRVPAQKAIDFIVQAQYNDGGWRYTPGPRGQAGDTSVVGWQLMALQSGRAANLTVPESTFRQANSYLDRAQHNGGATYSYQPGGPATTTMTAEGLLCRLYLGWNKSEPALHKGVKHLLKDHPPGRDRLGIYYWYYATQTLHHYGGKEWEEWNLSMRELLVDTQQREGHAAGSWAPFGEHSEAGGRIYMTALSACTLEVYYRHLPIFRQIKVEP